MFLFVICLHRKIMSRKLDQDETADALNHDVSQCCKRKRTITETSTGTKKRKHNTIDDDSDNDSDSSSRKKAKKKIMEISDTESVEAKPQKRKKIDKKSITPQEAAVSSIEKNPQIQVKKVPVTSCARKPPPPSTSISGISKPPVVNTDKSDIDGTPDLFAYLGIILLVC